MQQLNLGVLMIAGSDEPKKGIEVIRSRLKKGRSITVPKGAVFWLPEGYRAATVLIAIPAGTKVHYGPEPLLSDD